MANYVAVADLGATKILTGIASEDGIILRSTRFPTSYEGDAGDVIDSIARSIKALAADCCSPGDRILGAGVAVPGPLSYPDKVIRDSPNLKWNKVAIKAELQKRLDMKIIIEKDTNMAVLGEYYYAQECRPRNMLYLTISTGVGGGVITEGRLYRGHRGGAGEIGHMVINPDEGAICGCGRSGCLEALVSGTAIARQAQELISSGRGRAIRECAGQDGRVTAREVGMAARRKDPEACQIINGICRYLGIGIANLLNIFNPELVSLGGGVVLGMGDLIIPGTFAQVYRNVFALHREGLQLEVSKLGDNIGLYGALAAVLMEKDED